MRHYVIVLLIHPDQSEQVPAMLERYKTTVTAGGGKVHRVEDWGRRQMAYMIQKLAKAHYLCINIECDNKVLNELETGFRFNDAVLRHLTVVKSHAETTPSVMMKAVDREESRRAPQEASACLPALDVSLRHASEVNQLGHVRKLALEIRARAIGSVTEPLLAAALGV